MRRRVMRQRDDDKEDVIAKRLITSCRPGSDETDAISAQLRLLLSHAPMIGCGIPVLRLSSDMAPQQEGTMKLLPAFALSAALVASSAQAGGPVNASSGRGAGGQGSCVRHRNSALAGGAADPVHCHVRLGRRRGSAASHP